MTILDNGKETDLKRGLEEESFLSRHPEPAVKAAEEGHCITAS